MTHAPSPRGPGGHRSRHTRRARRRADRRRRNRWIAAIVGAGLVVGAGVAVGATVLLGDERPDTPRAAARRRGSPIPSAVTFATTATSVPGLPCRAPLTPDAPLRLWIAGDSIAWSVGNGLGKRAAATGIVAPVYESRVSSGIASPGFFDWGRRVAEELPRLDPEIVVFVMGTNDWLVPRPIPLDASGQPAWKATYARLVEEMVDTLARDGRTLYWVGPPVLRDPKQESGGRAVAEVIEQVVERHPHAVFVDAHDLLDGDDGTYTPTIDIDGKRVQVRTGDGVHLTPDGGDYLGDALFSAIDAQCRIRAQAVPGRRQPLVETKGSTSVPPGATATAPPPSIAAPTPSVTTPATTTPPTTDTPITTTAPPSTSTTSVPTATTSRS